ncbi:MAG: MMPL family transporter [Verrucomicrobiota bacterium]
MKLPRAWLWIGLIAATGLGLARLRFNVEILDLLPQQLPVARALKVYQENFSNARELIITIEAATAEQTESVASHLARLLREQTNLVSAVSWRPDWIDDPSSATELLAFLWLNQSPGAVSELTNRLAPAHLDAILAEARDELATSLSPTEVGMRGYDPYGLLQLPEAASRNAPGMSNGEGLFASADGTFRLVSVEARPDIISYRACKEWLAQIQALIAAARDTGAIPASTKIEFTGRPAFVTEIAAGMEKDMAGSASGTLATIGVLFWLTHRRLRPLLWLLFLLLVILGVTTALGGLFLGTINVVSIGFASILLGLAEDFGIVIYQESRSHPELDATALRREVAPGIFWSSVTTAGAFLLLNLSVLPGLAQLGTLVAIGIAVAAVVMLFGFVPPLLHLRRKLDRHAPGQASNEKLPFTSNRLLPAWAGWSLTLILPLLSAVLLWQNGIRLDHSPNVLKPKQSPATTALEQIKSRIGRSQDPLWILIPGENEPMVARRLRAVDEVLARASSNGLIAGFTLPTAIWPDAANQRANRAALASLVEERAILKEAALKAGFTSNSLTATDSILGHWANALASTNVFWPTHPGSHSLFSKVIARPARGFLALGVIHPTANADLTKRFAAGWPATLEREGVELVGWDLLGSTVFDIVMRELPMVLVPITCLVLVSLWLAFRHWREVALSAVTLVFSTLCLAALMDVLRLDWNILNVMALPLLLGMGVDFSIHIQLALRRYHGDLLTVRRSMGRALLLAGATTVAGFASLTYSTNAGMASLGAVCALGIALSLIVAVYLLPLWWRAATPADRNPTHHQ